MRKSNKSINNSKKQKANNSQYEVHSIDDVFRIIALKASVLIGNAWVFIIVCLSIIIAILMGYFSNFSDTWQLVFNLTISIFTFMIVFIIQNSQNRDTAAIQLKLDELIRSNSFARNTIIDLDTMSEKGIKELEKQYKKISSQNDDPVENDIPKK